MFIVDNSISTKDVWSAIGLWITKPSAYNKNVGAAFFIFVDVTKQPINPLEAVNQFILDPILNNISTYSELKLSLISYLEKRGISALQDSKLFDDELNGRWLIVRFILPKNGIFRLTNVDLFECDLNFGITKFFSLDYNENLAFALNYSVVFGDGKVEFKLTDETSSKQIQLKNLFFSKLEKWTKNVVERSAISSLSLVSKEKYLIMYNELKKKYCDSIKKIWHESTDPDKFIHEDLAIATYLILIWGPKPKKFVDLGCGNGLLVHILNGEGHRGHGVDVRSRKIWSSYPTTTILKEETIVPSPNYTFPGIDWIIGNHSDELTPWIPIIALLSSESANFFLLPCCAYEFDGSKYKRLNTGKSQYMDYLDYVETLCKQCGFHICRDRLKIPSTKRICFVSEGRTLSNKKPIDVVEELLGSRCSDISINEKWCLNFKPRDSVEKVRNCTQLDRQFASSLLSKISDLLLADFSPDDPSWYVGTPLEMTTIADNLPREYLSRLKNECGGLQTFLRNNHFVFKLFEGKVFFRKPQVKTERPKTWKVKQCWFDIYHPQRCPLDENDCSYAHVQNR